MPRPCAGPPAQGRRGEDRRPRRWGWPSLRSEPATVRLHSTWLSLTQAGKVRHSAFPPDLDFAEPGGRLIAAPDDPREPLELTPGDPHLGHPHHDCVG